MKVVGILLIAGSSTRFHSPKPKQICILKNDYVFMTPLKVLANTKEIDEIIVVTNKKIKERVEEHIIKANINAKIIIGGKTRQESVENALNNLSLDNEDVVLIHDGARPLLDNEIVNNVISAAKEVGAATTYIKETDTIAISENNEIQSFLNRENVVRIQTPQAFKYSLIKEAHEKANEKTASDDCTLIKEIGKRIKLVEGSNRLQKITTIDDLIYIRSLLK